MKKILSVLFVAIILVSLTGCSISLGGKKENKKKSLEDLVKLYEKAYNEEKPELLKEIFPEFMFETIDEYMSKEDIKEQKSYYGSNTKMEIKVTGKTKMDDEWVKENNAVLKEMYNTNKQMKECYQVDGTMTVKGSEKEQSGEIEELWYCDFDGKWLLIAG